MAILTHPIHLPRLNFLGSVHHKSEQKPSQLTTPSLYQMGAPLGQTPRPSEFLADPMLYRDYFLKTQGMPWPDVLQWRSLMAHPPASQPSLRQWWMMRRVNHTPPNHGEVPPDGQGPDYKTALASLTTGFSPKQGDIRQEITAMVPRLQVQVASDLGNFRQQFGFVPSTGQPHSPTHLSGMTGSSEAARKEHQSGKTYLKSYCANLAAIHIEGNDKPLLIRSSRSDTPGKLSELLAFAALHSQPSQEGHEGPKILQTAIVTAMDRSPWKNFWSWVFGQELEMTFLRRIQKAISHLFAQSVAHRIFSISHRAMPTQDGVEKNQPIAKPWHIELVFSGQARSPFNIRLARRYNRQTALLAFRHLAQVLAKQNDDPSQGPWFAAMCRAQEDASIGHWLKDLQAGELEHLSDQARSAIEVLRLTLVGSTTLGNTMLKATDPVYELWCWQAVFSLCDVLPAVQCKSGQDRTLTMVAALCAAAEQKSQSWQPYKPLEEQLSAVQQSFSKFANQLGPVSIQSARGPQGIVKWKYKGPGQAAHPVPGWLYTHPSVQLVGDNMYRRALMPLT